MINCNNILSGSKSEYNKKLAEANVKEREKAMEIYIN